MALPTTSFPTASFTVNGRDYTTRLLPASDALVLMPKIVKLMGRQVFMIFMATSETGLAALLADRETLGSIIFTICENAADNDGLLLLREMMRYTTCKQIQLANSQIEASVFDNFDQHFAGDLLDLGTTAIHVGRASFTKPSPA